MTDEECIEWREELVSCARTGGVPSRAVRSFPVQSALIVAGACGEENGDAWAGFVQRLEERLSDFKGLVISGGTRTGVCGEVGRLSAEMAVRPCNWTSVGYLPRSTPPDLIDNRYNELVFTEGRGFSGIEPLQYWTDILASGISPDQVTFLRYGGNRISDLEQDLAARLGAESVMGQS